MLQNQNLWNSACYHSEARLQDMSSFSGWSGRDLYRLVGNKDVGKSDSTKLWPDDSGNRVKAEREKLRDMFQQALREAYEIQSQTPPHNNNNDQGNKFLA